LDIAGPDGSCVDFEEDEGSRPKVYVSDVEEQED